MHTPIPRTRRVTVLVATLGLAFALAACSDDGDDAAADEAEPETIEVILSDFAFAGLPAEVDAGTRLTVVNEADAELHEVVAFRLPDDEDRSVEELTSLSPGELVGVLGEPVTVLLAEPDGPVITAVGDGTLDEPGRYALMCFIPTGADPAEYLRVSEETEEGPPQVDGGPPHFVHGMYAELTVR